MNQIQSLEEKAILTFQKNLLFLQNNNPKLFKDINDLSLAIEKDYYKERYSLEYKNGYFDVLEIETGTWLYGKDSNDYAKLAAKSVDYTKQDNLFETYFNMRPMSKESAKSLAKADVTQSALASISNLVYLSQTYAPKSTTTMKKIHKYIFLGTGIGTHITAIAQKIQSDVYFIIEDDLELFRLSLFVTDYADIGEKAKIIFSVFEDDAEFSASLNLFFTEHFFYNHYLKFFNMLSHSSEKLRQIQQFIAKQEHLTFNFSSWITVVLRPLELLEHKYSFLNLALESKTLQPFDEKPVLILGAGPSFQHNADWLQKNHSKFIIVAVSALLSKLEALNIKPDIVFHVDGFAITLSHIKQVQNPAFLDKTISLFSAFTQLEFADHFKKENVFLIEGGSHYKILFDRFSATNVGAFAYGIVLMLKAKDIYLLGLDLALDQETGKTHADAHAYAKELKLEEETELGGAISYVKTIIKTKGNFREEVFTTLAFDSMKEEFNTMSKYLKNPDQSVCNMSDGAYINETDPQTANDISTDAMADIDKELVYSYMLDKFNSHAENFLTDSELSLLEEQIAYCNGLIDVINDYLTKPHPTMDEFQYQMFVMFRDLFRVQGSAEITKILLSYFWFTASYIFDLINTREVAHPKQLMKEMNKSVIPQMSHLILYIRDEIQKHITILES